MEVCQEIQDVRRVRQSLGSVGFVPTMGFLHEGHLSLIKHAQANHDAVVVSLFVNPMQFGSQDDLDHYPRALEKDLALLRANNVDIVFVPEVATLYPADFTTKVTLEGVATKMEGESRPGHFTGVATVLTKLFNIVQPQNAYFGQKDAQQCAVIRRLVRDLDIPVNIVVVPTLREKDGLAFSSRNARLTPSQRGQAPALYKALRHAQILFSKGERSGSVLEHEIYSELQRSGIAHEQIDYAVVVDPDQFEQYETVPNNALALLAVRLGNVRLIDNMFLSER
ncbi:pantoate--beta-alanine ligase [Saccharibacter sp. 17.LH.SD]|uniref:pantoate--beta-alanine ligase n=1 Tax=Saccharibacter sp. 17.LH.SD TaxID=2689393 RepID=UPI001370C6B3|nr:pantoate--beta-alanine ligase [Saccharibacter sp. 17.LH.SD]